MADSLTPNLKLRLSDDLTADSKYNLNRIDSLASATKVENNGNLRVRSVRDIILTPESQDLGGSGTGGTVSVGEAGINIETFEVFADVADFNDTPISLPELRFPELPGNGINYVGLKGPDSILTDTVWTLPAADGAANQVIVTDGAGTLGWASVLTDSLAENAVNIGNASGTSSPTDTNVLGEILADSVTGLVIKDDVIIDSKISTIANISLSKLAPLTFNKALVSDASGVISASGISDVKLGYLSDVTSLIQAQINDKQPLNTDLTALSGLTGTGIIVRIAAGTVANRTLIAGTGINISNADGVAGDITINSTVSAYTDEMAQDAVGTILTDSSSIGLTYSDATPSINATLNLSSATADSGFILSALDIQSDGLRAQINKTDITSIISGNSFKADWATVDGTSKVITHNLNTKDVIVQLYDSVTFETIYVDSIVRTSVNSITLTATQTPGTAWRVLIQGI